MIRRFLVAGCVVAAATSARAFPSPRVTVALGGAQPVGPAAFTDAWNLGPMVAGGVAFEVSRRITVGGEVTFHRFSFDDDAFTDKLQASFPGETVGGNDLELLTVGAVVEVALQEWGTTKPFLLAGAGYDNATRTASRASGPNASLIPFPAFGEDGFAMWAGAGVRTALTPGASLFLDASYHFGPGDEIARFVPIRLGVSF